MKGSDHILVVEDLADDLFLLRHSFIAAGVRNPLIEMRDGQQAINYLSGKGQYADRTQHPLPCFIITDVKIPRVDGFGLLKWLQDHHEFDLVPRVVLSNSGTDADKKRATQLGAYGYYVKPTGFQPLIHLVKHLDDAWIVEHCPISS